MSLSVNDAIRSIEATSPSTNAYDVLESAKGAGVFTEGPENLRFVDGLADVQTPEQWHLRDALAAIIKQASDDPTFVTTLTARAIENVLEHTAVKQDRLPTLERLAKPEEREGYTPYRYVASTPDGTATAKGATRFQALLTLVEENPYLLRGYPDDLRKAVLDMGGILNKITERIVDFVGGPDAGRKFRSHTREARPTLPLEKFSLVAQLAQEYVRAIFPAGETYPQLLGDIARSEHRPTLDVIVQHFLMPLEDEHLRGTDGPTAAQSKRNILNQVLGEIRRRGEVTKLPELKRALISMYDGLTSTPKAGSPTFVDVTSQNAAAAKAGPEWKRRELAHELRTIQEMRVEMVGTFACSGDPELQEIALGALALAHCDGKLEQAGWSAIRFAAQVGGPEALSYASSVIDAVYGGLPDPAVAKSIVNHAKAFIENAKGKQGAEIVNAMFTELIDFHLSRGDVDRARQALKNMGVDGKGMEPSDTSTGNGHLMRIIERRDPRISGAAAEQLGKLFYDYESEHPPIEEAREAFKKLLSLTWTTSELRHDRAANEMAAGFIDGARQLVEHYPQVYLGLSADYVDDMKARMQPLMEEPARKAHGDFSASDEIPYLARYSVEQLARVCAQRDEEWKKQNDPFAYMKGAISGFLDKMATFDRHARDYQQPEVARAAAVFNDTRAQMRQWIADGTPMSKVEDAFLGMMMRVDDVMRPHAMGYINAARDVHGAFIGWAGKMPESLKAKARVMFARHPVLHEVDPVLFYRLRAARTLAATRGIDPTKGIDPRDISNATQSALKALSSAVRGYYTDMTDSLATALDKAAAHGMSVNDELRASATRLDAVTKNWDKPLSGSNSEGAMNDARAIVAFAEAELAKRGHPALKG